MAEQGCGPLEAVMSDNAKCYSRSHAFRDTLAELGARHILIPPYTPRWNGKIERFFGTLEDEWAHGRLWPNSTTRDRALSSFIRSYNRHRPHSAARRPPTHHPRPPSPRARHLARAVVGRRLSGRVHRDVHQSRAEARTGHAQLASSASVQAARDHEHVQRRAPSTRRLIASRPLTPIG